MIFYYIIFVLLGIIGVILTPISLFPHVVLPAALLASFATTGTMIGVIYNILPDTLTGIFAALSSIVGIEIAIFAYKFIRWIYQKIPGIA